MNKGKLFYYLKIFFLIPAVFLIALSCMTGCERKISRTFFTADTVCSITLYDANRQVLDDAVALCNTLSASLNCKNGTGIAATLNTKGRLDAPDADLLALLHAGIRYSEMSNGVFDITMKPVTDLWDFTDGTLPDPQVLATAITRVNYKNVQITDPSVVLKQGAQIDLGGIAKGFIADKVSDFLLENGVKSAIINLGGNVVALGNHNGKNFSVGIQKPFSKDDVAATVHCSNLSVVTSGTYQRFFEKDGIRYHHLLNSKTGMPVNNGLDSVTILAPRSVDADALSTLCFLQGKEQGRQTIEALPGIEAVWIDSNGNLTVSTGLSIDSEKQITLKSAI